jgi:hypothetical protein
MAGVPRRSSAPDVGAVAVAAALASITEEGAAVKPISTAAAAAAASTGTASGGSVAAVPAGPRLHRRSSFYLTQPLPTIPVGQSVQPSPIHRDYNPQLDEFVATMLLTAIEVRAVAVGSQPLCDADERVGPEFRMPCLCPSVWFGTSPHTTSAAHPPSSSSSSSSAGAAGGSSSVGGGVHGGASTTLVDPVVAASVSRRRASMSKALLPPPPAATGGVVGGSIARRRVSMFQGRASLAGRGGSPRSRRRSSAIRSGTPGTLGGGGGGGRRSSAGPPVSRAATGAYARFGGTTQAAKRPVAPLSLATATPPNAADSGDDADDASASSDASYATSESDSERTDATARLRVQKLRVTRNAVRVAAGGATGSTVRDEDFFADPVDMTPSPEDGVAADLSLILTVLEDSAVDDSGVLVDAGRIIAKYSSPAVRRGADWAKRSLRQHGPITLADKLDLGGAVQVNLSVNEATGEVTVPTVVLVQLMQTPVVEAAPPSTKPPLTMTTTSGTSALTTTGAKGKAGSLGGAAAKSTVAVPVDTPAAPVAVCVGWCIVDLAATIMLTTTSQRLTLKLLPTEDPEANDEVEPAVIEDVAAAATAAAAGDTSATASMALSQAAKSMRTVTAADAPTVAITTARSDKRALQPSPTPAVTGPAVAYEVLLSVTPPFAWRAGGGFVLASAAKAKLEAEQAAARLARRRAKRLRYLAATAKERSLRCVTIRVVEGVGLKNLDTFKKQDPYVRVTLKDAMGTTFGSARTKTLWRGGVNPQWTEKHVGETPVLCPCVALLRLHHPLRGS